MGFGLFGVPRLRGFKPPEGGTPHGALDRHPPDQEGRGHRYAPAYPPAGGVKAINSRPRAGILAQARVRENRMSQETVVPGR